MKLYEIKEKVKFNQDDLKILSVLAQDPRIRISKLSKITNIPRERINYRIGRMQKLGLIQGFCSIINFPKINYRYYILVGKIKNLDKLKSRIDSNSRILKAHLGVGDFSIVLEFYSKDIGDAKNTYNSIRNYLKDIEIYEVGSINRYLHLNPKDFGIYQWLENGKKEVIDIESYYEILKILTENCRIPISLLKNKISKKEIEYLFHKEILIPYLCLNTSLLGYRSYFVICEENGLHLLRDNSIIIYKTAFNYDYLCVLDLKSEKEFQEIQNKLESSDTNFKFMIETSEVKYTEI